MIQKIKYPFIFLMILSANILFAQFTKDIKLKLSVGVYGMTPPTNEYVDDFGFSKTLNYSLGLEKDYKLNTAGTWLLRSEILYNRTNIKVGLRAQKDDYKLDHLLLPLKLVYVKNRFQAFVGLINNYNFDTRFKDYEVDHFEQVGTFNYERDAGATLYKNTFVDKIYSIQYSVGFELVSLSGNSFGLEFIDYFGYKNYYSKYFGSSYDSRQISSSALNVYMTFNLNSSQKE